MKDLPAELPAGLCLAGVSPREDVRDALISANGLGLDELPAGGKVGTSSLRRQAQLLALRPDLKVVSIRGNVETRLRKLKDEGLDAVILAAAGLSRLGFLDRASQFIDPGVMLPAVGQGALGLECREDDDAAKELVLTLSDADAACAVDAERTFLARLEGGCQVPIAGYATVEGSQVELRGLVASLDGSQVVRAQGRAPPLPGRGPGPGDSRRSA